ncbi:RNA polymerase sigma-70 factor [Chitinophaga nivalis]|uniref:RNA polymerase sigma-70 factor n=1 Tax=Chitinophaga nivalis TaxID=2991709 RepID=A0ABT3IPC5_9BACT|nr:RNA polymerase sigma-70 factor [Chitinophaga nivalis]MCW3464485.1 RNA polymerase sigma-70 factor [Chitinophaga nivalis]MCW3485824.1 RNA polymerase sigma-70 factor [Chitinophaga nivalis]
MPHRILHIALPEANNLPAHELFTHLFRTYGAKIFFYFKKYVKSDVVAEDLLQEVFANLWTKQDSLSTEKNIEAYLFVSARNQLYNHLKQAVLATPVTASLEDDLSASYNHVEESMHLNEMKTCYYEALATLPAQRRKAFILSREQGMSYQEIAAQMNISPRTVEKHISASLQLLRHKLTTPCIVSFLFIIW